LRGQARALLSAERTAPNSALLSRGDQDRCLCCADRRQQKRVSSIPARRCRAWLAQKIRGADGEAPTTASACTDAVLIKENHIVAAGGIARYSQQVSQTRCVADFVGD
jgi:nicotinate-nucleotide pyrophosphorylase